MNCELCGEREATALVVGPEELLDACGWIEPICHPCLWKLGSTYGSVTYKTITKGD